MQFLSKILSFVLTAYLLLATSSVPLVYHFCGDEMESVSIGAAKQCDCKHDEHDDSDCCAKDCCHNELHVSDFHPDVLLNTPTVVSNSLVATLHAVLPFSSFVVASEKCMVCALTFDTHPPARSSDIPVLFRSLLI